MSDVIEDLAAKQEEESLTETEPQEAENTPEPESETPASDSSVRLMQWEGDVDIDLTGMNANMIYSEVYNMMAEPDNYIGKTIRCGTESQPSEFIALTADRIYLIHVFHYGTKAYGGVNQREWVLESGTERRKEMNPLPALKDQRSMLQKLFTREKAGSVPMELLLVFSDTYGRTRFQLDGVTNALDIRDMNSWWKKRPARFSGRLDFAKVKQILDRSLA